jgi:hypothetical protein
MNDQIPTGVHTGENRDALLFALERLVAAVAPFAARHKQDKCFCRDCNELRAALLFAAKIAEKLQPPTL